MGKKTIPAREVTVCDRCGADSDHVNFEEGHFMIWTSEDDRLKGISERAYLCDECRNKFLYDFMLVSK